jgi:hypothetical protein
MSGRTERPTSDAGVVLLVGGSLLVASVVVASALQPVAGFGVIPSAVGPVLFAAALVVGAVGLRGVGSVTGRAPLGTVALVALAVWIAVFAGIGGPLSEVALENGLARELGYLDSLVRFALALIAVVQIARARVVPPPWNRAPAVVLAAVVVVSLVQLLALAVVDVGATPFVAVLVALDQLVRSAGVVVLGIAAIVLGTRARHPLPSDAHEADARV